MLIPYWSYSIEKNWNGKITKEIADTNIFCYGKKGTGKTERIGRMCLLRALDQRRSALVYASNNQEYMDLINTVGADQNIYIFNAGEETDEEDVRIIKQAVHTPTVIIVNNERFTDPHQITIVDQILNIWDEDTKKAKPEGLMHVILDDLCGNLYIRSRWLNNKHMKFCMIMGSEIASAYWRSNTCYDMVKYMHDHKIDLPAISSFAADADEKDEDYAMHRFPDRSKLYSAPAWMAFALRTTRNSLAAFSLLKGK